MNLVFVKPILSMALACTVWGLSGLYYNQLAHIPTLEVLAHRSLWSMIFFSLVLIVRGRFLSLFKTKLTVNQVLLLSISALMISTNWFVFIYAIQTKQAVQASFGYYVFPLVAVIFGYIFKRERFSFLQSVAIFFAFFSVIGLGFALKIVPLISLVIAITFGAYGLIKGYVNLQPIESVSVETILLAPVSIGFLSWLFFSSDIGVSEFNVKDYTLLIFSGVITGGPLILFSFATKKINYATIGIIQYINPTLQFLVAILIFSEPFNVFHSTALIFIWIGLIIYSVESWRLESRR